MSLLSFLFIRLIVRVMMWSDDVGGTTSRLIIHVLVIPFIYDYIFIETAKQNVVFQFLPAPHSVKNSNVNFDIHF